MNDYRIACEARGMGIPIAALRDGVLIELEVPIPSGPPLWEGSQTVLNPLIGEGFDERERARILLFREVLGPAMPDGPARHFIYQSLRNAKRFTGMTKGARKRAADRATRDAARRFDLRSIPPTNPPEKAPRGD